MKHELEWFTAVVALVFGSVAFFVLFFPPPRPLVIAACPTPLPLVRPSEGELFWRPTKTPTPTRTPFVVERAHGAPFRIEA